MAETTTDLEVREAATVPATVDELTIGQLVGQVDKIQQALQQVMKVDVHYGTIPGTPKPTLYKPGAEKLCLLFRLAPDYQTHEEIDEDGHYTVRATCRLTHSPTGNFVGSGEALCTSKESRYAKRKMTRVCPACGKDAIIKGKQEYGGGWLCFRRKGGCGQKFPDGAEVIESQPEGETDNDQLPDTYNTVLKMACKRALVAGVLNVTAASDIFTQDLEDSQSQSAPSPPSPATPPAAEAGSAESYDRMMAALEANNDEPRMWAPEVVLANTKRQFNHPIESLMDLTDQEMQWITTAAMEWRVANPIESADGEVVYDPKEE